MDDKYNSSANDSSERSDSDQPQASDNDHSEVDNSEAPAELNGTIETAIHDKTEMRHRSDVPDKVMGNNLQNQTFRTLPSSRVSPCSSKRKAAFISSEDSPAHSTRSSSTWKKARTLEHNTQQGFDEDWHNNNAAVDPTCLLSDEVELVEHNLNSDRSKSSSSALTTRPHIGSEQANNDERLINKDNGNKASSHQIMGEALDDWIKTQAAKAQEDIIFQVASGRTDNDDWYKKSADALIRQKYGDAPMDEQDIQKSMERLQNNIKATVERCLKNGGLNFDQAVWLPENIHNEPLMKLILKVFGDRFCAASGLHTIQLNYRLGFGTLLESLIAADITAEALVPLPQGSPSAKDLHYKKLAEVIKEKLGASLLSHLEDQVSRAIIKEKVSPEVNQKSRDLARALFWKLSSFFVASAKGRRQVQQEHPHTPMRPTSSTLYISHLQLIYGGPPGPPEEVDDEFPDHLAELRGDLESLYKDALKMRSEWEEPGGARYSFSFPTYNTHFNPKVHDIVEDESMKISDQQRKQNAAAGKILIALMPTVRVSHRNHREQKWTSEKVICHASVRKIPEPET